MMTRLLKCKTVLLSAMLALVLFTPAQAAVITNGGFEAGLAGWTIANQTGSEGSFALQTGTQSPVTMTDVPPPPGGTSAAMTDALGPGSHVLYQDFVVPVAFPGSAVSFSLFINNAAPDFFTPAHLDFASTAPEPDVRTNQQARVDIITTSADVFSVAPGDVLQNLYQTRPGDPLVSGYSDFLVNVESLFQTRQGQTLRLRFAEVDNVLTFNLGVDNVDVRVIPEPSTWVMTVGALAAAGLLRRRIHLR